MSLNYTPLRHKMLAKIAAGEVSRGLSVSGWAIIGVLPTKRGHCERAVDSLVGPCARIPGVLDYRSPLVLTEVGKVALHDWSARHGEPQ